MGSQHFVSPEGPAPGREDDWRRRYDRIAEALPRLAATARTTLAGFSAFVDASVRLNEAEALFDGNAPPQALRLGIELRSRVERGIGGEISLPWPEGDAWLAATLRHDTGAGGTALQIANMLGRLRAPVVLALADRGPALMALIEDDVLLAEKAGLRRRADIVPSQAGVKARHWIFEATAGTHVAGLLVRRSTRIIVRLADDGPERDRCFEACGGRMVDRPCGAGVISSLVATPDDALDETLASVATIAAAWRRDGVPTIHLEGADYASRRTLPLALLTALRGSVTSVGMSLSEWKQFGIEGDLAPGMRAFAERWDLERVCVHADEWAGAVTRKDVEGERLALMTGALLAAARAAAGEPVVPASCPPAVTFCDDFPTRSLGGGWSAVGCPSPYSRTPRSTIGLGDTFVAGCLLIWCQPSLSPDDLDLQGLFE